MAGRLCGLELVRCPCEIDDRVNSKGELYVSLARTSPPALASQYCYGAERTLPVAVRQQE